MRMMVMDWLVVNSKSFEKEKKRSPNTNRLIKTTRKTVEKRGCWSIAARDSGERRRNTEVKKPRRRSQPASQLVCVPMTMANTDIISQPRWQLIEWLGELLVQTVVPPMMVVIVVVVVATIISKWTQWPPRVFAGRYYTGNTALTDEGERKIFHYQLLLLTLHLPRNYPSWNPPATNLWWVSEWASLATQPWPRLHQLWRGDFVVSQCKSIAIINTLIPLLRRRERVKTAYVNLLNSKH